MMFAYFRLAYIPLFSSHFWGSDLYSFHYLIIIIIIFFTVILVVGRDFEDYHNFMSQRWLVDLFVIKVKWQQKSWLLLYASILTVEFLTKCVIYIQIENSVIRIHLLEIALNALRRSSCRDGEGIDTAISRYHPSVQIQCWCCVWSAGDNDADTTAAQEAGTRRGDARRDRAAGEVCGGGPAGRGRTAWTVPVDSWTDEAAAPGKLECIAGFQCSLKAARLMCHTAAEATLSGFPRILESTCFFFS